MLLFHAAILTISDESDRDFMKHLYINHAARMFRVARALTDSKQDAEEEVGEAGGGGYGNGSAVWYRKDGGHCRYPLR